MTFVLDLTVFKNGNLVHLDSIFFIEYYSVDSTLLERGKG